MIVNTIAALAGLAALALPGAALAAAGDPDPTFAGGAGVALEGTRDPGHVVVAPDGRIVVAVASEDGILVTRLRPDGSLDPSFDQDGRELLRLPGYVVAPHAVALESDGDIVVGGRRGTPDGTTHAAIWRLRAQGGGAQPNDALDPAFSGDGVVVLAVGGKERAQAVAVDGVGRVLVAGGSSGASGGTDAVVWRLTPGGQLDSSFDADGTVWLNGGGGSKRAFDLALRPDGRIVLAGYAANDANTADDAMVWRLLDNGAFDPAFSGDGVTRVDNGGDENAYGVALLPDGRVVAAGYTSAGKDSTSDAVVWRLTAEGALDTTFDVDGAAGFDSGRHESAYDVVLQEDGKPVVALHALHGAGIHERAVWRARADGGERDTPNDALDPTFDQTLRAGATTALALQADQRVLALVNTGTEMSLERLLADPRSVAVTRSGTGSGVVTSDGPGIDCGSVCEARLHGPVTLTAAPAPGSTFAGWTGACSGTGPCALDLVEDAAVGARFELIEGPPDTRDSDQLDPPATFGPKTLVTLRVTRRGRRLTARIANANPFAVSGMLRPTLGRKRLRVKRVHLAGSASARVTFKLPRKRRARLTLRLVVRDPAGKARVVTRRLRR